MRKIVFLALFAMLGLMATAQIKIPGTNVEFTLPEGEWKYLQTTNVDKNTNVYLYSYMRRNVLDANNDTIIPFLRVYVHKNYANSIYDLAYDRSVQQPFQSLDEFSEGVPNEGIGYIGAYTSPRDGKDYIFRMIYFKDKNTIYEFRAETTIDTYKDFEGMFADIIKSVKVTSKN